MCVCGVYSYIFMFIYVYVYIYLSHIIDDFSQTEFSWTKHMFITNAQIKKQNITNILEASLFPLQSLPSAIQG